MVTSVSSALRIAVVDDSAVYREGMARSLSRDARFELVGQADDGPAALELVERTHPDLALIDVSMPGMDGVDLCSRITAGQGTRVVLISAAVDDELLERARRAGASACLDKDLSRREICTLLFSQAV